MIKFKSVRYPVKVYQFGAGVPEVRDSIEQTLLVPMSLSGDSRYRDDLRRMLDVMVEGINLKIAGITPDMVYKNVKSEIKPEPEVVEEPVKETEVKEPAPAKKQRGRPRKK